jgi:hypothetical protein
MPTTISPASERLSSPTTADSRLEIDSTRARQTERQTTHGQDGCLEHPRLNLSRSNVLGSVGRGR